MDHTLDSDRRAHGGPTRRVRPRDLAVLADSVASTMEQIAELLEEVARRRPQDAERIQQRVQVARRFAEHERQESARFGHLDEAWPAIAFGPYQVPYSIGRRNETAPE